MKVFKVTDKYSIAQLDDRNWTILFKKVVNATRRKKTPVEGKEMPNTGNRGYYRTLERAKEALAQIVSTEEANFKELEKWIDKIKEV